MVHLISCYDFKLFKVFQNKYLTRYFRISLGGPLAPYVWGKWTTRRIEPEVRFEREYTITDLY